MDTHNLNPSREEVEALRELLRYHSRKYYDEDQPEISDQEYDRLLRRLEDWESAHPEWADATSPTQRVGGQASARFSKVEHQVPMQSLNDVFSRAELFEALDRMRKLAGEEPIEFIVEAKIDGLSVSLEYEKGKFVRGSTRGDGHIGELITDNLLQLQEIPKTLPEAPPYLELRGEVYMSREGFLKLNQKQEKEGLPLFANPRNAAAGSLRQLDAKITAQRPLSIFCFNIQQIRGKSIRSHAEGQAYLHSQGFPVAYSSSRLQTNEEVWTAIEELGTLRSQLAYLIDGAVIKVDDLLLREKMGTSSKAPRWAVAYKYPAESQETVVREIVVQVGRTGKLAPLALLDPVLIDGSTVRRATLHNENYIREKDIRIGDTVVLEKAGDVIPAIRRVILEKRPSSSRPYQMPQTCPSCGETVERLEGEVDWRCVNPDCPAQLLRHLIYFVSKDGLDIPNLGPASLELFVQQGWIHHLSDLFRLEEHEEELLSLPGFGEKSVRQLLENLQKAKQTDFARYLSALGMPYVGKQSALRLSEVFSDFSALKEASLETLEAVPDIGKITARAIVDFLAKDATQQLLADFETLGVSPQAGLKGEKKGTGPWQGKTFVLTGGLTSMTRTEAKQQIEERGGTVTSAVSGKTDVVVAGEGRGSKRQVAEKKGLPIWEEDRFLEELEKNQF